MTLLLLFALIRTSMAHEIAAWNPTAISSQELLEKFENTRKSDSPIGPCRIAELHIHGSGGFLAVLRHKDGRTQRAYVSDADPATDTTFEAFRDESENKTRIYAIVGRKKQPNCGAPEVCLKNWMIWENLYEFDTREKKLIRFERRFTIIDRTFDPPQVVGTEEFSCS